MRRGLLEGRRRQLGDGELFVRRGLIVAVLLLTPVVGASGCKKKLECRANDIKLQPGQRTFIDGKTYSAGAEPCCLQLRDGEIVSDCHSK